MRLKFSWVNFHLLKLELQRDINMMEVSNLSPPFFSSATLLPWRLGFFFSLSCLPFVGGCIWPLNLVLVPHPTPGASQPERPFLFCAFHVVTLDFLNFQSFFFLFCFGLLLTSVPEELPTNALSKLVCVKSLDNQVVGFHYVGPNAGEVTQGKLPPFPDFLPRHPAFFARDLLSPHPLCHPHEPSFRRTLPAFFACSDWLWLGFGLAVRLKAKKRFWSCWYSSNWCRKLCFITSYKKKWIWMGIKRRLWRWKMWIEQKNVFWRNLFLKNKKSLRQATISMITVLGWAEWPSRCADQGTRSPSWQPPWSFIIGRPPVTPTIKKAKTCLELTGVSLVNPCFCDLQAWTYVVLEVTLGMYPDILSFYHGLLLCSRNKKSKKRHGVQKGGLV